MSMDFFPVQESRQPSSLDGQTQIFNVSAFEDAWILFQWRLFALNLPAYATRFGSDPGGNSYSMRRFSSWGQELNRLPRILIYRYITEGAQEAWPHRKRS